MKLPAIVAATRNARKRDSAIGTQVKGGRFTIIRATPNGTRGTYTITTLAGPMDGRAAVATLDHFAKTGKMK